MIPTAFLSFVVRVMVCLAATGTLSLAYAYDQPELVFDLNSLIWMLIGALGWGAVSYWLGRRSSRRSDMLSAFVPGPVPISPASNFLAAERDKDGESDKKSENLSEYLTPLDETTTVTVEELSNVVEQVDLFLLLGRHEVAVSMLLARIREEDKNDPRTWFKLLDVYHARGDRDSFEKLANDIRGRFNVALPSWEDSTLQAEGRHGLEHFPHLLERISDCWGTSASLSYLQSLVKDNRSGARTGFNEDAFREVMFLISILEQASDRQ
jgi:hypothetical protein